MGAPSPSCLHMVPHQPRPAAQLAISRRQETGQSVPRVRSGRDRRPYRLPVPDTSGGGKIRHRSGMGRSRQANMGGGREGPLRRSARFFLYCHYFLNQRHQMSRVFFHRPFFAICILLQEEGFHLISVMHIPRGGRRLTDLPFETSRTSGGPHHGPSLDSHVSNEYIQSINQSINQCIYLYVTAAYEARLLDMYEH